MEGPPVRSLPGLGCTARPRLTLPVITRRRRITHTPLGTIRGSAARAATPAWRRSAGRTAPQTLRRAEPDRQAAQAAQRIVVAAHWLTGDLDRCCLVRQRRQHDLPFQPSEDSADATMDARAEADMAGV